MLFFFFYFVFFFQAEDGIRDRSPSRGLGDVYKRQENVHLSDGYLDILQSKGHRDRRLFLSDELISYLIEYDCAIRNCFPKREYFFPGPSGNIISASSIPFNFRKIWLAAGLKRDGEIKPRPYDFRHHFACANIARWAKERKDVISMLPYLCLLYTSDAADEEDSVDLRCRRNI